MKKISKLNSKLFVLFIVFLSLNSFNIIAQSDVPSDVKSVVKMKLEDGQAKLTTLGYEICSSSLFGRKQDWYNEKEKVCVTIKFDKSKEKLITEVLNNSALAECQKGLEASRAVWLKYHDGSAPFNAKKLDEERKKLSDKGFVVSYWIEDVSPGRSCEYWIKEAEQKTMMLVWEISGVNWVMTNSVDFNSGHNPAPKK